MPRLVASTTVTQSKTTIPEPMRNMFKIEDGDKLDWYDGGNIIIVKRRKTQG